MKRFNDLAKAAAALALIFSASSSFAANDSRDDLINSALNANLNEREQVTGSYKENESAARPVAVKRSRDQRIEVVLDSELSGGGGRIHGFDSTDRAYHEPRVEAHLDREVKAVDRAYDKAMAPRSAEDSTKASVRALLNNEG